VLPDGVALDGTVADATPTGTLTSAWSQVSGPGTVTFAAPGATDTTATFSAAGTYVLRLTASDGSLSASDDMTVTAAPPGVGSTGVLDIPVRVSPDDAEQRTNNGKVTLNNPDLNLAQDRNALQRVGMRFTQVAVPKGATITSAYVQFTAGGVSTAASNLVIAGQASDDPATFTAATNDLSARPQTTATVSWKPAPWSTVGARTTGQRTPDLRSSVQEIVDRTGWVSGNSLVLFVSGTGERTADAFEGGAARAPLLHIEYAH
jgi:hypothetical protein